MPPKRQLSQFNQIALPKRQLSQFNPSAHVDEKSVTRPTPIIKNYWGDSATTKTAAAATAAPNATGATPYYVTLVVPKIDPKNPRSKPLMVPQTSTLPELNDPTTALYTMVQIVTTAYGYGLDEKSRLKVLFHAGNKPPTWEDAKKQADAKKQTIIVISVDLPTFPDDEKSGNNSIFAYIMGGLIHFFRQRVGSDFTITMRNGSIKVSVWHRVPKLTRSVLSENIEAIRECRELAEEWLARLYGAFISIYVGNTIHVKKMLFRVANVPIEAIVLGGDYTNYLVQLKLIEGMQVAEGFDPEFPHDQIVVSDAE